MALLLAAIFLTALILAKAALPKGLGRAWVEIFIATWAVVLIFSSVNPFELYSLRSGTYGIYVLFVCAFALGFVSCLKKFNRRIIGGAEFVEAYDSISRNRWFLVTSLIALALLFNYLRKYISYVSIAGIGEARDARFLVGGVFQSGYEYFLFTYLIVPFIWIAKFLFCFGVVYRRMKSTAWVLSSLNIGLYMGFGAGRNVAIEIALLLLFMLLVQRRGGEKRIKKVPLSIPLGILAVFALFSSLLTVFRIQGVDDINLNSLEHGAGVLVENFSHYFMGSLRAFQHALDFPAQYHFISYGFLTFSGVDELMSYGLKAMGFQIEPYSWTFAPTLASEIDIGGGATFNALYSAPYYFYFDFGLPGMVVLAFFYGVFSAAALRVFIRTGSISAYFVCSIMFMASIWTLLTWRFQSGDMVLVVLLGLILAKRKKSVIIRDGVPNE